MSTRDEAFAVLKKYNKDPFHIQHALTVEAVMKWYASELGFADEAEYWGIVGLLHDIDFELYPEEHCLKAPELLRENGILIDDIRSYHQEGYSLQQEKRARPISPSTILIEILYQNQQKDKGFEYFNPHQFTAHIRLAPGRRPVRHGQPIDNLSVKTKGFPPSGNQSIRSVSRLL